MESDSSPIVGSTVSASSNGHWAASISPNHPILMYNTHTHTHIGAAIKQFILRQLHHKTDNL
jgi:hypothetical protein